MRFQVPQFINVEDHFGPFTIKQAIYLGGSLGLSFIVWQVIPIHIIAIVLILPIAILGGALAFYKVNGLPFIFILEAAFRYATKDKLYLWKKVPQKKQNVEATKKPISEMPQSAVPRLSQSRLKDLAWSLDINENSSLGAKETMQGRR